MSITAFINTEQCEKLWGGPAPIWLWDVEGVRIVWANQAYLDFSGALTLSELVRLKFSRDAPFAQQLAIVSTRSSDQPGELEQLCFPTVDGEFIFECKCSCQLLDSGKKGVLVELVTDKGKHVPMPDPKTEKPCKNGLLKEASPAREQKVEPVPLQSEDIPHKYAPPENHTDLHSVSTGGSEPEVPVNGFEIEAGQVDEEDLRTLQEIARMINGPGGGNILGVASANGSSGPYGGAGRPVVASRVAEAVKTAGPDARDGSLEPDGQPVTEKAQSDQQKIEPVHAHPEQQTTINKQADPPGRNVGGERNYFLESLPAAIAIAMGGRLMRANETFLYAFGFGSESELRKAGGLATLFPQSRNGVLIEDPSASGTSKMSHKPGHSARIETLAVSRSGRQRQIPIAFRNVSTGREPVQILILHEDALWRDQQGQSAQGGEGESVVNGSEDKKLGQESIDFLATVSHEVRTPLNSIIGFSELMKDERFGEVDVNRFRGYASDIHESAMHALSLINDLLDITKIMAGKPDLDFESVKIEDIAIESLNAMRAQAQKKQIILQSSIEDDLPALYADRRSLKQILLNLLSNAIKFTKTEGQVSISARLNESNELVLSVSDTGIGMDADEIDTALEPFGQIKTANYRATSDVAANEKGTGLGLPLTKALVKAHHASFDIISTPGQGTSIEIKFPTGRLAR